MWFLLGGVFVAAFILICLKTSRNQKVASAIKIVELIRSIPSEPMPAQHVVGNVYMISYMHEGQVHRLYFPIRPRIKEMYKGKDVYLSIGTSTINLNQEPGVPYCIQADDFSEDATISAISEDDGAVKFFEGIDEIIL